MSRALVGTALCVCLAWASGCGKSDDSSPPHDKVLGEGVVYVGNTPADVGILEDQKGYQGATSEHRALLEAEDAVRGVIVQGIESLRSFDAPKMLELQKAEEGSSLANEETQNAVVNLVGTINGLYGLWIERLDEPENAKLRSTWNQFAGRMTPVDLQMMLKIEVIDKDTAEVKVDLEQLAARVEAFNRIFDGEDPFKLNELLTGLRAARDAADGTPGGKLILSRNEAGKWRFEPPQMPAAAAAIDIDPEILNQAALAGLRMFQDVIGDFYDYLDSASPDELNDGKRFAKAVNRILTRRLDGETADDDEDSDTGTGGAFTGDSDSEFDDEFDDDESLEPSKDDEGDDENDDSASDDDGDDDSSNDSAEDDSAEDDDAEDDDAEGKDDGGPDDEFGEDSL